MASFEIFTPSLDGYEETQEAFAIDPEELALTGLSMISSVAAKHVKRADFNPNYGYVTTLERQGRKYWLRGLYLHEDEVYDPVGIPRIPEELPRHLQWHQDELDRLQHHGFTIAKHLPVVVKDEDRWGEAGYGLFTIVEDIPGHSLQSSLKSRFSRLQKPALQALSQLLSYYQDPERPQGTVYMRDICYMRQYNGLCLVDLDPLPATSAYPNELAHLGVEASKLRSQEGKRLRADIRATWMSQLDIAIQNRP